MECFTLKTEALQFFRTLETTHMMTQRRVTEGLNLQQGRQCTYHVTFRRDHVTTVAREKQ